MAKLQFPPVITDDDIKSLEARKRAFYLDKLEDGKDGDDINRDFDDALFPAILGQRLKSLQRLIEAFGVRYADCSFEGYETEGNHVPVFDTFMCDTRRDANNGVAGDKNRALAAAMFHCNNQRESQQNLVLAGTVGSGKDHMLYCILAKLIFHFNCKVKHYRGCNLSAELREGSRSGESEKIIKACINADVLSISDPIPPKGDFSEFIMQSLLRIIDNRYANMKPTYMTVNLVDKEQMAKVMGNEMADRILDRSRVIRCNWESYRKQNNA